MLSIKMSIAKAEEAAVQSALAGVKKGVANRVLRSAIAKMARIGAKAAKSNIRRERTGSLRKSIGIRSRTYRGGESQIAVIGARRSFRTVGDDGKTVNPAKYSHLLERGRKAVVAKGGGLSFTVGAVRAKGRRAAVPGQKIVVKRVRAFTGDPFMEPAVPAVQSAYSSQFVRDVREGLAREVAKYAAKGKSVYAGGK
jgi:hypothetical protein